MKWFHGCTGRRFVEVMWLRPFVFSGSINASDKRESAASNAMTKSMSISFNCVVNRLSGASVDCRESDAVEYILFPL